MTRARAHSHASRGTRARAFRRSSLGRAVAALSAALRGRHLHASEQHCVRVYIRAYNQVYAVNCKRNKRDFRGGWGREEEVSSPISILIEIVCRWRRQLLGLERGTQLFRFRVLSIEALDKASHLLQA